jgi:hypothetical protein
MLASSTPLRGAVSKEIQNHQDLLVYRKAFDAAMSIFELSRSFPKEETYSLTDQIRRSSRSVCSNLAEAWRKRRYEAAFSRNYPTPKARQPKPRCGWNLP